jgi:hypothetical protein
VASGFELRPVGVELGLCQRYYENGPSADKWIMKSATAGTASGRFAIVKRNVPFIIFSHGNIMVVRNDFTNALGSAAWNTLGTITQVTANRITPTSFIIDITGSSGIISTGAVDVFSIANSALWNANSEL